ncbi:MAG: heavy metal-associated domain-containing protein [Nitrospirales bacterium]
MKKHIITASIMLMIILGPLFIFWLAEKPSAASATLPDETVTIPVEGLTCPSCAARIRRTLKAIDGVTAATVNLETFREHHDT